MAFTVWKKEEKNMLRVVITRPGPGSELSFRTRYPVRPKSCLLVPPLYLSPICVLHLQYAVPSILPYKLMNFYVV